MRHNGVSSLLTTVAMTAVLAIGTATTGHAQPIVLSDAAGIHLLGARQLDARLWDVAMSTSAIPPPVHVRVLLPAGYGSGTRRYPTLYLLHGALSDDTAWTVQGDAEASTANAPVIVVMPEGGNAGWYTDWFNLGQGGPPEWETFHIDQLIPWVDHTFRTVAARSGRAIAGLSMGGFGALSYAARHPDLFVTAMSFSGAVDTNVPAIAAVIDAEPMADGFPPSSVFGLRTLHPVVWRDHDPWDLAGNLRGLKLAMYTGNGRPGRYDAGRLPDPGSQFIEGTVAYANDLLDRRLTALGIAHYYDNYGPGTHSWAYWRRDLRLALPSILDTFADPPPTPTSFDYTSADPSYSVYDWTVRIQRPAMALSSFDERGPSDFTVTGEGTATVTTPADYQPYQDYPVTIRSATGSTRRTVPADGSGRLVLDLPAATGSVSVRVG